MKFFDIFNFSVFVWLTSVVFPHFMNITPQSNSVGDIVTENVKKICQSFSF